MPRQEGHVAVTELLLAAPNVGVNAFEQWHTPLHHAAAEGCHDMVGVLLAAPNIVANATDGLGTTPLYLAAELDYDTTVEVLLAAPNILFEGRWLQRKHATSAMWSRCFLQRRTLM